MVSGGWQKKKTEVSRDAFFKSVPYRPSYTSPFDQEKLLVAAALAVAGHQYFRSDLEGYRSTIGRIGSYLEHALITNDHEVRESDVWKEYLHDKATIESLFGEPSTAARLNSEVTQLCSEKRGRALDQLMYDGCTMCCRVESLTPDEDHLLAALESRLTDLLRRAGDLQEDER